MTSWRATWWFASGVALSACGARHVAEPLDPEKAALRSLVLDSSAELPSDPTNRYADDPLAAALGHKLFSDTRFSGPLLDDANDGLAGTLGHQGETGKVACASCHSPQSASFVDTRSPRGQLSLASGWTHRAAPTLLGVGQASFLTSDGRRDAAFSLVFGPIQSPVEFNSSLLFVAQQMTRLYRADYEAIFGPMPDLGTYSVLAPDAAGCTRMPSDSAHGHCPMPGDDDDNVLRVIVNFGKAVSAYTRQLTCGRGRFDAFVDGDAAALDADELAGMRLFVGKADCARCHSGPNMSDQQFHNVGTPGGLVLFTGVNTLDDPGAQAGLALARADRLNSRGPFSDGDDGRLDRIPTDPASLLGAFRTPSLRCVSSRRSFMHNSQFRSLEDVVGFFSKGAGTYGYVGTADNPPLNLSKDEQRQLVAFMRALNGPGPSAELRAPPILPP